MQSAQNTTILLDIYERLGTIEEQLRTRTKEHDEIEKHVIELLEFKSRVGAYIWLGGSIASGVLFFLYEGVKYLVQQWLHQ
ncbi:MAG TPA: hypothetical protein VN828_11050 [Acidobacteriaceae bacterium]|nr:hypothetical protein [Acidobacteriaceae bacterium]